MQGMPTLLSSHSSPSWLLKGENETINPARGKASSQNTRLAAQAEALENDFPHCLGNLKPGYWRGMALCPEPWDQLPALTPPFVFLS